MTYLSEIKDMALSLGCEVRENEPMAEHTSFGAGGSVSLFIEAEKGSLLPLYRALKQRDIPFMTLGKGTNVLFKDGLHELIVLSTVKKLSYISVNKCEITAGCGASLMSVCRLARDNSLAGLEFAYGIPASVGGAVYMNAGAYGGEMSQGLKCVTAIDEDGEERVYDLSQLDLSYRHSRFSHRNALITEAVFSLREGNREDITALMNELMGRRRDKQPLEYKSAGSTFKRPPGAFAGALIEQCGLKGYSAGDAMVSTKHAGFVVNTGKASASDILSVIDHVRADVLEKTGYDLECEVEIIGE